jgi:hypothetical protein
MNYDNITNLMDLTRIAKLYGELKESTTELPLSNDDIEREIHFALAERVVNSMSIDFKNTEDEMKVIISLTNMLVFGGMVKSFEHQLDFDKKKINKI